MQDVTTAVIGTGANPDEPSVDGFAMGYRHAEAYQSKDGCELVACADLVRENALAFANTFDISEDGVFEDYREMIAEAAPDLVSICVPPAAHAELVIGAAEAGVKAIHCEKPMAMTWGEARLMAEVCDEEGVQLTFNHQRRFLPPFPEARRRLDAGEIGDLVRIEYSWGNFFDNGTHAIDMCNYFNAETPAEWVLAQLDYEEADVRFGTHNENQMLALWKYENGVYGQAITGPGADASPGDWRLLGTDGVIEVSLVDELALRIRRYDDPEVETIEYERSGNSIELAIADVVESVRTGEESGLCARNALNATQIIFGGYESARSRRKVEFPLSVEDNPLESMVAAGQLEPNGVEMCQPGPQSAD